MLLRLLQRIQVECLTATVVAFVVTVELICVARQNGMPTFCLGKPQNAFSQTEGRHSCLATSVILPCNAINSTVTTNATTEIVKHST